MAYENAIHATYRFPAAPIDTDAVIGYIVGPEGKEGRLVSVGVVVTVTTATNPTIIEVGISGTVSKYGYCTVAAVTAPAAENTDTISDTDDNQIPADSLVIVGSDGGAASGDGDVIVVIAWF